MIEIDIAEEMPGSFELYSGGDRHCYVYGYPWAKEDRFIRHIQAGKHRYWSDGGDLYDNMSPQDKRYKLGQTEAKFERVDRAFKVFTQKHQCIADKLLWMIDGNHGLGRSPTADWVILTCEKLGCHIYDKYDESNSTIKVNLGALKLIDWHGSGSVNSKAGDQFQRNNNDKLSVKKKLRDLPNDDCDLSIMHHIHKTRIHPPSGPETIRAISPKGKLAGMYFPPTKIWMGKTKYRFTEEDQWYASSGTLQPGYTTGRSGYAERAGYRFSEMSWLKIVVKNDKFVGVEEHVL